MCKRQRLASAEAASDPRARWIVLDDFQKAVTAASTVPWCGAELLSGSTAPVSWERVSTGPSVAPDHLWHPDHWQHDLVWAPCATGAVAIHRFTPQPGASSAEELTRLSELAAEEMAGGGGGGDSASNVGGYHGARDLWSRPELHEGALPWLVGSAVQQAAAGAFDLILMDVQMPELDGLEATAQIRGLPGPHGQTPIIGMTAYAFAEDREACLAAGMNDYISKPIDRADLIRKVQRWTAVRIAATAVPGREPARP